MACCGQGCGGCGGCRSRGIDLELTECELALLRQFAQLPFLPVARRYDGETPVCLEPGADSQSIQGLTVKGLIRTDYDLPLTNFDYRDYEAYPCKGSMALTARGQEVLELLEIQGIEA